MAFINMNPVKKEQKPTRLNTTYTYGSIIVSVLALLLGVYLFTLTSRGKDLIRHPMTGAIVEFVFPPGASGARTIAGWTMVVAVGIVAGTMFLRSQ